MVVISCAIAIAIAITIIVTIASDDEERTVTPP